MARELEVRLERFAAPVGRLVSADDGGTSFTYTAFARS